MRHTFIPPLTAIPFMEVHNLGSMYYHYHHVQPGYPKLEINDLLYREGVDTAGNFLQSAVTA